MFKKALFLLVVLSFCLAPVVQAASIVWVSDNKGTDSDQGWIDMLIDEGYDLNLDFRNAEARSLDAGEIDALNAADLIIISRDTDSGNYASDGGEIAAWNAITAPILMQVAHITRSSRWLWLDTTATTDIQPTLEAVMPGHPVFKGVALGANGQVDILTTVASFPSVDGVGNGTLIASADSGQPWIVEWQEGVEFYAGSGQIASGPRMFLAGGSTVAAPDGTYNYTDAGKILFLNAIKYMLGGDNSGASEPVPAGGAVDVPQEVILSWTAGEFADQHDVYFGTVADDVNNASTTDPLGVLVSEGQAGTTYDPEGLLAIGQTYYWRIDEVNLAPNFTVSKGAVWSFTVEPLAYPIENIVATASSMHSDEMGPEKTIDGSGLDADDGHSTAGTDMWLSSGGEVGPSWIQYEFDRVYKLHEMSVWNSNQTIESFVGMGAKDVTIQYATDLADWVTLEGTPEFAQAPGTEGYVPNTTVDLGGVMAKYVRLVITDNWGLLAQSGLSEVRIFQIPVSAREPQPAVGQADVGLDVVLNWRAGREAAAHEVYLDTDEQAVIDGTALVDTVANSQYAPAGLEYGKTYYWKVNEVNDAASPASVEGAVWSFTTIGYFVVDDMESYTDDEGSRIYETWIDGWTNGTGSLVGYLVEPFAEQTIVNGGTQSMPLDYNNVNSPWYSETEQAWDSPQNWTGNGVTHLLVHFQGNAVGFVETGSDSFTMGAAGADIWNSADEFRYAFKKLNGNGSIVARVDSVVNTNGWVKGGVMIRESLDAGAKFAAVYITPANGCRFQARALTDTGATSDSGVVTPEQTAIVAPYWVKLERTGDVFNGFYSADGIAWTAMAWNPQTVNMIGNVYVGLALTSHVSGVSTTAEFSGVATTGSVSGSWQAQAIGVEQPANDPAPLYVALEDSAGHLQVVAHADPSATTLAQWQEWAIPLTAFSDAGVNLTKVKRLIIGAGDRDNPTPGGAGLLYIDDIQVGVPE